MRGSDLLALLPGEGPNWWEQDCWPDARAHLPASLVWREDGETREIEMIGVRDTPRGTGILVILRSAPGRKRDLLGLRRRFLADQEIPQLEVCNG